MAYTLTGKDHCRYKHGMGSTKQRNIFYMKWAMIKRRCYNKNDKAYERYGAKGIKMSDEWLDFINFYNDMHESYFKGATIDRIDNSKGYSKENCRWATKLEQAQNKTTVVLYEFGGKKMHAQDWDKYLGLVKGTVRMRIKVYGWDIEKALTTRKKKVVGYSYEKNRNMFKVEIQKNGKKKFIGRYKTKEEAKMAFKLASTNKSLPHYYL